VGLWAVIREKLIEELLTIQNEYPELQQAVLEDAIVLKGELEFNLIDPDTGKPPIEDSYCIEITILFDFPDSIPKVKEVNKKIKRDYEHIDKDGFLCLGFPSKVGKRITENPTIEWFVDKIVKPNLFFYSFFKKYGYPPWRAHEFGGKGLFKHYATLLKTSKPYAILQLIGFRVFGNYDGHKHCPCGNGKKIMECHVVFMNQLWDIPVKWLKKDFKYMLRDYFRYYKRNF